MSNTRGDDARPASRYSEAERARAPSRFQVKIFGPDADAWKAALFSYIDHAQLPTDLGGTALSMAERPPGYFAALAAVGAVCRGRRGE